jgi:hypothetical protein
MEYALFLHESLFLGKQMQVYLLVIFMWSGCDSEIKLTWQVYVHSAILHKYLFISFRDEICILADFFPYDALILYTSGMELINIISPAQMK